MTLCGKLVSQALLTLNSICTCFSYNLPRPLKSKSESVHEDRIESDASGSPRCRHSPAAAALSTVRATATVSATLLGSGPCEPTLGYSVKQWPPRCQHLQKTLPFTAERAIFRSMMRVFYPAWRLSRAIGRGLAIGSPSRPPLAPPPTGLFLPAP